MLWFCAKTNGPVRIRKVIIILLISFMIVFAGKDDLAIGDLLFGKVRRSPDGSKRNEVVR